MYGEISGPDWGEQSDNFKLDKNYDKTLKYLSRIARENHPILQRIQRREWDVKQLAKDYPAKEDVPEEERSNINRLTLADMLTKECEENGPDSEWAQKLRAAMNWKENSDEIKTLEEELYAAQKARDGAIWWKSDEERASYYQNREKAINTERSLQNAIESAIAPDYNSWYWDDEDWDKDWDNDWNKDYGFKDTFMSFLSDIARSRQNFREQIWPDEEIRELTQKYLQNPLWHLPQITDFLLVDLMDSDLIMLERDFYFGLFSKKISNQLQGPNSHFMPGLALIHTITPCLSENAKKERWKWRFKKLAISAGLIYFLLGTWEGKKITDLLISKGVPSWVFIVIWIFTVFLFVIPPINSIVMEERRKRGKEYKSLYNQAHNLLNIRWDIYSGTYDARTCIERLKKLDDQDLHISSLIYPLLELQLSNSDAS